MGWAERANPRSIRNLDAPARKEAFVTRARLAAVRAAKKVYAPTMNYMQAFVASVLHARRQREAQRKAQAEGKK